MKEKILIFANSDVGLYKFRKEIIEKLSSTHKVYISVPFGDYTKEFINMGCNLIDTRLYRRGVNIFKDLKLFFSYMKIARKVKPDLIITYTIKPNIYGALVARYLKIKYYINITGLGTVFQKKGLLKNITIFLYKISTKKAKVLFFENEENKNVFVKNKIGNLNKMIVLNGAGVNLSDYPYTPIENQDQIRFLFIGRIMIEKGILEFLNAAKVVKEIYPTVKFDIIGPMEEDFSLEMNQMTNDGIINYYGNQSDVKKFIVQSSCVVLPSYHEGMSNALLEAAAMGRPLIASNISGCKEIILDGISGLLVKSKDFEDLSKKMIQFINLNFDQRVQMGNNSRKHIEEKFDKKNIVEKTMEVISES